MFFALHAQRRHLRVHARFLNEQLSRLLAQRRELRAQEEQFLAQDVFLRAQRGESHAHLLALRAQRRKLHAHLRAQRGEFHVQKSFLQRRYHVRFGVIGRHRRDPYAANKRRSCENVWETVGSE